MKKQNILKYTMFLIVLGILVFTGCSKNSNPTDPNNGGGEVIPKTSDNIDITLKQFYVHRDCDGIEGDGEFDFKVQILNSNNQVLYTYNKTGLVLGNGGHFEPNYTVPLTFNRTEGNKFKIRFICTEWDVPLIGNPYHDTRMDENTLVTEHIFSIDKWSNISGTRYLIINPGSDCSTEFNYSVTVR